MIGLDESRGAYLFELVEHDELQRQGRAGGLLGVERLAQHDADDEALGPVVEHVQVDDGDLLGVEVDRVRGGVGQVGPDEVLEVPLGRRQPAHERADRPPPDGPAAPVRVGVVVGVVGHQLGLDDAHEVTERAHRRAVDAHRAVAGVARRAPPGGAAP